MSYQSAEDDDDARTPAPVYGPFLPSQDSATKQPDPPAAEATTSSSSQKPEQIRTERSSASTKTETTERPVKKDERFDDEIQKLKALHEKFQKRAQQLKQFTSKDSDAKETASVGESPDLQPVSDVPSRPTTMVESVPEVPCSASEVEVATEETLQAADDQTFVRFEYTNRRYESDEAAGPAEEMELDVEDIDKQLEMALAQHKVSYLLTSPGHGADTVLLTSPSHGAGTVLLTSPSYGAGTVLLTSPSHVLFCIVCICLLGGRETHTAVVVILYG